VTDRAGTLHIGRTDKTAAPVAALAPDRFTTPDGDEGLQYVFELHKGRAVRLRTFLRCEPVETAERITTVQ
jgi:hypothetical protein